MLSLSVQLIPADVSTGLMEASSAGQNVTAQRTKSGAEVLYAYPRNHHLFAESGLELSSRW